MVTESSQTPLSPENEFIPNLSQRWRLCGLLFRSSCFSCQAALSWWFAICTPGSSHDFPLATAFFPHRRPLAEKAWQLASTRRRVEGLPSGLRQLTLGANFNQSLGEVLPRSPDVFLFVFYFGACFVGGTERNRLSLGLRLIGFQEIWCHGCLLKVFSGQPFSFPGRAPFARTLGLAVRRPNLQFSARALPVGFRVIDPPF